jgi:hypothetical protein
MAYGQIVTMRLADGRTVEFADWSDKPLYSSINVLHGTTQQEMAFYQYVQGDPVPSFAPPTFTVNARTANERDTNMAVPGAMSSEEEFLVFAIRPEVFAQHIENEPANFADFQNPAPLASGGSILGGDVTPPTGMLAVLALRTILFMEISEKRFPQAGFGYFNFGAGAMATGGDATAGLSSGMQGLPSQEAVRTLVIPSHIGGTEKFRVVLFNADGVGLEMGYNMQGDDDPDENRFANIRIYLDGLYRRGTA